MNEVKQLICLIAVIGLCFLSFSDTIAYQASSNAIIALDWSPDGNHIARVLGNGTVEVLDSISGAIVFTSNEHQLPVNWASVKWNPIDSTRLAVGLGSSIYVWNISTGENTVLQAGSQDGIARTEGGDMPEAILSINWSPSGKHLAACSLDGILRTWVMSNDGGILVLDIFVRQISSIVWSPNNDLLYVAAGLGLGKIDPVTGEIQRLGEHALNPGTVTSIGITPDGLKLVSATVFGQVLVWNVTEGERIYGIENPREFIREVRWSPDGSRFVSAGSDGAVRVWDATTGQEIGIYQGGSPVFAVTWSPDGTYLAYGGENGALEIVTVPGSSSCQPTAPTTPPTYTVAAGDTAGLVSAISAANANPDPDIIALGGGTYTLTTANNTGYGPNGLPPYGSKTNLRGDGRSGSLPIVVADDTPEHIPIVDRTLSGHRQSKWTILIKALMRPPRIVISEILGQDAAQMAFVEHDQLVQTLFADGAHPVG